MTILYIYSLDRNAEATEKDAFENVDPQMYISDVVPQYSFFRFPIHVHTYKIVIQVDSLGPWSRF